MVKRRMEILMIIISVLLVMIGLIDLMNRIMELEKKKRIKILRDLIVIVGGLWVFVRIVMKIA
jgi:hypothetical protein